MPQACHRFDGVERNVRRYHHVVAGEQDVEVGLRYAQNQLLSGRRELGVCQHDLRLALVVDDASVLGDARLAGCRTERLITEAQHPLRLDEVDRRGVYLSEGLGHAFLALTDDANVSYLCSEPYRPGHEHGIHPLDPELGLLALPQWPSDLVPLLSDKDAAAPTLAQALEQRLLPDYARCQALVAGLTGGNGQ